MASSFIVIDFDWGVHATTVPCSQSKGSSELICNLKVLSWKTTSHDGQIEV